MVSKKLQDVVSGGICTGCGACVACVPGSEMVRTDKGPVPVFPPAANIPDLAWEACPGKGVDYPALYRRHFGHLPGDWRIGIVEKMWTGFAAEPEIRRTGASGGATTRVLIYLLEEGLIDGAVLARQGSPSPEEASWFIARSREEILACAQSVYIPVSMLDSLCKFIPGEKYAMTCLPEQSAALRVLQAGGHPAAQQVSFILGPYTGTALYPAAIRSLLRSKGVSDSDRVVSLQWRAGEWPGYLRILTESGREIQSKKVYYNFLIPFFVTQTSLQSMDFANEFADLSVGDAWSPKFESLGAGFSVIAARSSRMVEILETMQGEGLLDLTEVDPFEASAMHGHMIDFKKRGGYLRNRMRRIFGRAAPDYGLRPEPIGFSRLATEVVISTIFAVAGTPIARGIMEKIPENVLGPLFNRLRLLWKAASKPAKRKGLGNLKMVLASSEPQKK